MKHQSTLLTLALVCGAFAVGLAMGCWGRDLGVVTPAVATVLVAPLLIASGVLTGVLFGQYSGRIWCERIAQAPAYPFAKTRVFFCVLLLCGVVLICYQIPSSVYMLWKAAGRMPAPWPDLLFQLVRLWVHAWIPANVMTFTLLVLRTLKRKATEACA